MAPLQPVEGRLAQLAEAVAMLVAGAARHRRRRARQLDDAAVAHALRQRAASELGRQHNGLLRRTCIAAHDATRAAVVPPTQSVEGRLAELALRRVWLPVLMLPAPVSLLIDAECERRHLQCGQPRLFAVGLTVWLPRRAVRVASRAGWSFFTPKG